MLSGINQTGIKMLYPTGGINLITNLGIIMIYNIRKYVLCLFGKWEKKY